MNQSPATSPIPVRNRRCSPWRLLPALLLLASPAPALTIHLTYDASITSLPNAATVEAALVTAAQAFENQYTNPITINLTMYWGNAGPFTNTGLGASLTQLVSHNYSQVLGALTASRLSAADFSSVASLPASDPTGSSTWYVPRAENKALGLSGTSANDSTLDGQIGFSSSQNYTFDPNNRAVPGKFDFIAVAEHEMSEVLGRIHLLKIGLNGYVPFDLFRFTASGARSFSTNAPSIYFSVDDGATELKFYYTNSTMGDLQDWLTTSTPDAYNAFANSGRLEPISAVDVTTLDILGYDLAPPQPVPPVLTTLPLSNGLFRLSFTNVPGTTFTVVATTNITALVTNWTVLGATTEGPAGHFQFTDPQPATSSRRFYGVRTP